MISSVILREPNATYLQRVMLQVTRGGNCVGDTERLSGFYSGGFSEDRMVMCL